MEVEVEVRPRGAPRVPMSPLGARMQAAQQRAESELPSPKEAPPESEGEAPEMVQMDKEDWKEVLVSLDSEAKALEEDLMQMPTRSWSSTWLQDSKDLARWSEKLWTDLGDLRYQVKMLQRSKHYDYEVKQDENNPPVRRKAVGLRISTYRARQGQEFETLLEEQDALEASLRKLQRCFKGWEERPCEGPVSGGLPFVSSSSPKRPDTAVSAPDLVSQPCTKDFELHSLEEELKALDAEGGRGTGGWPLAHHEIFVRILRTFRMKVTPQCYCRLEKQFPDVSQADLAEHLRFCHEQEARQARRRLILSRWRQRRVLLKAQGSELDSDPEKEKRRKSSRRTSRREKGWK